MAFVLTIADTDKPVTTTAGDFKYSFLGTTGDLPAESVYTVTYNSNNLKISIKDNNAKLAVNTLVSPIRLENASYDIDTATSTMTKRGSTAPAQAGETAAPPTAETAAEATASAEIFNILSSKLSGVSEELDKSGEGDFATGQSWNQELKDYIAAFNSKEDIVYSNDTFPNRSATVRGRIVGNKKTISEMQGDFAEGTVLGNALELAGKTPVDGLPQHIQKIADDNSAFKDFIYIGHQGALLDADSQRMYDDLVGLFTIFGIESKLDKIYEAIRESKDKEAKPKSEKEETPPTTPADTSSNTTTTTPADDATDAASATGAAGASGSSAGTTSTAPQTKATEKPADEKTATAEPVPDPDEGQTIGFYVTIFGADAGTPAQIEIDFNDGIGDNAKTTYNSDPIPGTKFNKLFAIRVRNEELVAFWKANRGTDATVRITAVPSSGGDAITVEHQIPIKWPLSKNLILLPNEVFRFSETTGRRTYTGLAADEGRGGAKDNRDKQDEVAQLFYTTSGGIKLSTIPVSVDAVGRTYRFTFSTPTIVPIKIDAPAGAKLEESRKLSEAAVPHWIFLSNRPAGRGGSGGSGGGTGGGKKAVNIAVSQFAIKTSSKWITVPNVGSPWDKDTFKVNIAKSGAGAGPDEGAAPILGLKELNEMGISESAVKEAVFEALFGSSAAWSKLGISNNCWARDPSVSGTGGVTAREITYKVGGSA